MPAEQRLGHIVECNTCKATAVIAADDTHIHDALKCGCCPIDHNHGDAAGNAETGGVPCRPVTVYANAVLIPVGM